MLSGLADNTVIVLPRTCCEAAGLAPNINDKAQPKTLVRELPFPLLLTFSGMLICELTICWALLQWIGRLKHLNRLLSATSLQQAVQPQEVRRSFLQVRRMKLHASTAVRASVCRLGVVA